MIRRHSLCLSDIPSFAESLSIDTYHGNEGQDDSIAIYNLRRASSPAPAVMPVDVATASVATDIDADAEVNGNAGEIGLNEERSKAAKRKNKKKKSKSRPKKDRENGSSTDGGPLVVNGAGWKHEVTEVRIFFNISLDAVAKTTGRRRTPGIHQRPQTPPVHVFPAIHPVLLNSRFHALHGANREYH